MSLKDHFLLNQEIIRRRTGNSLRDVKTQKQGKCRFRPDGEAQSEPHVSSIYSCPSLRLLPQRWQPLILINGIKHTQNQTCNLLPHQVLKEDAKLQYVHSVMLCEDRMIITLRDIKGYVPLGGITCLKYTEILFTCF